MGGKRSPGVWSVCALAGALLLASCGGGGGGGGGGAAPVSVAGAAVKGIAQHALVTARELGPDGASLGTVGTAITGADGNYSLTLSGAYTGKPILLTLTDAGNAALPTTVVCDVRPAGCGAFAFGDSMPIGALVLTALHPGTAVAGAALSMQVTPYTHAAAQAARNLAQNQSLPLDAALVNAVNQNLGDLLGGIDLLTVKPVNLADATAVAAAGDHQRLYAYLAAAIGGLGFGQTGFSGTSDPLAAVMAALTATFQGGSAPYDDGGAGGVVGLAEIFAEAIVQANAGGDTEVATHVGGTDAAASGGDHDLLPDSDGDGTRDYADTCPHDPADDADGDGLCADVDACPADTDNDLDGDGICNGADFAAPATAGNDNCPATANASQADGDGDGTGDACDVCPADAANDADSDGVCGDVDVCPGFNDLADADSDGTPDGCDACPNDAFNDADGDGICVGAGFKAPATGANDNCPNDANPGQADGDADGVGDACDPCPGDADNDSDGDGYCNGASFEPPAVGGGDNCPAAANPDQSDTDGDGAGDACDPCPEDATDACAVDTDGDGILDPFDVCPIDADNDSDGDGICVGAEFQAPATAGGDNCPTTANPGQEDTDADGIGDACDTGQIQVGSVTFDPAVSADLSAHPLAPPMNGAPWPFLGYGGTTGGFGVLFTKTVAPGSGVPVTQVVVTAGSGNGAIYDLARATDGAIYYLYAKELDGNGDPTEVTPTEPIVFLGASVAPGATWTDHLGKALYNEADGAVQVMGNAVTSPAGYTGTTHIRTTYPGEVMNLYWRTGEGIVDSVDSDSYRRADRPPVPGTPLATTGTIKTLAPGDTWTYLEVGATVAADGTVDPATTYTMLTKMMVTDRTVTEAGGSRVAHVMWFDVVESIPGVGDYPYFGATYYNQAVDRTLRYLGTNGDWLVLPVDGSVLVPGAIAVGTTWGGPYTDSLFGGVEADEVQAKETVTTGGGSFEAYRIAYTDTPKSGTSRPWTDMDTDWFSPAVGNYVQSVGTSVDAGSGTNFVYAEQLVDYGPIGTVDTDGDGVPDIDDTCPHMPSSSQTDSNGNGIGDACDFFGTGLKPGAGGAPGPLRHHR